MDQLTRLPHHLARPSGLAAAFRPRACPTTRLPPAIQFARPVHTTLACPIRSCGKMRHAWAAAISPRHDHRGQTRGILRHARPSAPPRLPLPRACSPFPYPGSSEPGWGARDGRDGHTGSDARGGSRRRLPKAAASCGMPGGSLSLRLALHRPLLPLAITRGIQSRGLLSLPARPFGMSRGLSLAMPFRARREPASTTTPVLRCHAHTCGILRHAWVVATPSPSPCARRRPYSAPTPRFVTPMARNMPSRRQGIARCPQHPCSSVPLLLKPAERRIPP